MKGHFLEREYFYDSHMKKDENVAIVGNCLEQLVAIVMKNTYNIPIDYYAMAIGDLSFHVRFDRDGYFVRSALKCNETDIDNKPWTIHKETIIGDGAKARDALQRFLGTYGYAIVRTADGHLEFSRNYDETCCKADTADYTNFSEAGHVFLIVGEDADNYYYVEQPNEINRSKYVCARGRRDIGIYPKAKFQEAFQIYLGLIRAEFDEERLLHTREYGEQILGQSADHFYHNHASRTPENDSFSILGGRAALYRLDDMLRHGKMILHRKVFNPTAMTYKNHTIGEEFLNGMTSILNRRAALDGYLQSHGRKDLTLEEDIRLWKHAKETVLYRCNQENSVLSREDISFERIVQVEEELFRSMGSGMAGA